MYSSDPRRLLLLSSSAVYVQVTDLEPLTSMMQGHMDRHNVSSPGSAVHMRLFPEAVRRVLFLLRALQQPQGNVLLLGPSGCGKRSLAAFAASYLGWHCPAMQIRAATALHDFRCHVKVCSDCCYAQSAIVFTVATACLCIGLQPVSRSADSLSNERPHDIVHHMQGMSMQQQAVQGWTGLAKC